MPMAGGESQDRGLLPVSSRDHVSQPTAKLPAYKLHAAVQGRDEKPAYDVVWKRQQPAIGGA
jgi:hypothetical protein